jgi:hypothetical protein
MSLFFYYIFFTLFYNVKIPIMYVYELYVVHDKLAIKLLYIYRAYQDLVISGHIAPYNDEQVSSNMEPSW